MEINSIDSLLDWLEVKPRTLGWGAVLAYGRSETNKVLMQEYITRFGTGDYMEPITDEIRDNTTPTQKDYLHNYQMDAPRLSFKDASLQKSSAKLTMKEVGGTHLSFTKSVGSQQWSLTRIAEKDVLDGPGLIFDIDLMKSAGSVSSAGRVELNIAEGSNYRLIDMPSEHLQRVAGERFKTHFRGLPPEQKIFVLNELRFEPNQFLKPSNFIIRTHNKLGSGARLSAGEDEGEGAVLVFVAMEGDANGNLPIDNADLKYLLPDGYSATVLLGNEMLMKKIMTEGLRRISASERPFRAEFKVVNGFTEVTGFGDVRRYAIDIYNNTSPEVSDISRVYLFSLIIHFSDLVDELYPGVASINLLSRSGVDGVRKLYLEWEGNSQQATNAYDFEGNPYYGGLGAEWRCGWVIKFGLDADVGTIHVDISPHEALAFHVSIGTFHDRPKVVKIFPQLKINLEEELRKTMPAFVRSMFDSAMEINAFTLNSLLFRGNNAVKLDSVHFPGDLAAFGHVGPTQTAFSITELEPIIPHTVPFQFHIDPPRENLTWSVRNILGETIPKGTITNRGLYTPPTAAEMPRSSIRVVITATDGTHSSSALVGITSRSMAINPLIMIVTAGDSLAHDVSAGASDGGPLVWPDVLDSGAVVRPNPAEGKDHSYVPGPPIDQSSPTVDTIVVTNPRTQVSETTSVLVLHRAAILEVAINDTVTLPENQLQLSIMGEDGPINPGDWDETWQVLLGSRSAQIDADTGLLTLNPAGPDKFVVVTVLAPPGRIGGPTDDGYIVLPLPLFSVPETVRMFRADS